MWETQIQSLDCEDPLEKEMATHSSILAWKILWMEGGVWQSTAHRLAELDMTEQLHFHFSFTVAHRTKQVLNAYLLTHQ